MKRVSENDSVADSHAKKANNGPPRPHGAAFAGNLEPSQILPSIANLPVDPGQSPPAAPPQDQTALPEDDEPTALAPGRNLPAAPPQTGFPGDDEPTQILPRYEPPKEEDKDGDAAPEDENAVPPEEEDAAPTVFEPTHIVPDNDGAADEEGQGIRWKKKVRVETCFFVLKLPPCPHAPRHSSFLSLLRFMLIS